MLAPTPESRAVTQVPMFWPMMMGMAVPKLTAPVMHRACKMPTEAEEDWMMAVRAAPASRPRTGLEKAVRTPVNFSFWARGETEELMASMPNIKMAKPTKMVPMFFFLSSSLAVMVRMTPMAARIGEKELGFRSFRNRLLP